MQQAAARRRGNDIVLSIQPTCDDTDMQPKASQSLVLSPQSFLWGLLLALFLAGCHVRPDPHSLVLWHAWGGNELQTLRRLINGFKAEFPQETVYALPVPFDQLKNKYQRAASAGGGPDLLISSTDWFSDLVQAQLVAPLDDRVPASFWERFHPFTLEPLRTRPAAGSRPKLYAVPESYEVVALYYNRRLVPAPPPDTDSWLRLAVHLTSGDRFGLVFNTGFYFSAGYLFGFGGNLFDSARQPAIDSPQADAWLRFLLQLRRTREIIARNDYGKADALFKQGKAAMIINGPWALADYRKALGKDLGVASLPRVTTTGRPAAPFIGVKNFMVNANSDDAHQRLALQFVEFCTRPLAQTMLMEGAGHLPANLNVPLPKADPVAVFAAQARLGTPLPTTAAMSVVWDPMDKVIEQVLSGEKRPRPALQEIQHLIAAKIRVLERQPSSASGR